MYSKVINGSYLYLPKDEIVDIGKAKKKLTVRSKFGSDPIPLFVDGITWFGVPRYFFHPRSLVAGEIDDRRECGDSTAMVFTKELWEGQERIVDQFRNSLRRGHTGFLLEGAPGSGKTVQALAMMSILGRTSLVVVPRSNLINQWIDRIVSFTNLPRSAIGKAEGGKVSAKGKKVVIGLVHTLALDRFGDDFRNMFGCVVFDEVDRSVPPETFAPVVGMFPAKYRIGMSATLDRADGLHTIFEQHIGETYLKCRVKERMKPRVIMRKFDGSSGYVHAASARMSRRGMLISRLSKNAARNMMIARYVAMILKSDRQCLVLSDRKEQLVAIRGMLVSRFKINSANIGFFVDSIPVHTWLKKQYKKMSKAKLDSASTCSVVLGTYGKAAIGTDIPSLSGLIFATPQSDIRQSVGRIERFLSDKKEPVIVDIIDTHYKDAVQWAAKRRKYYASKALKVKVYS